MMFLFIPKLFFQQTGRMESFYAQVLSVLRTAQVAWNAALTKGVVLGMQRYRRV